MKTISGCVYCTESGRETSLCCRHHARLVCDECRETNVGYARDHPKAA